MEMEKRLEVISELAQKTESKIVLIVFDGLGDIPIAEFDGKTPLESAKKPNMTSLARSSSLGLMDPIAPGITPGSGPGHLGIFGYDPLKNEIGRGLIEGLGIGFEFTEEDVAARFNFATMDSSGAIIDRRAGRIESNEAALLCGAIQEKIKEIDGAKVFVRHVKEHRGVVVFRKKGIGGNLPDTDPQKTGIPQLEPIPLDEKSKPTAEITKKFIYQVNAILSGRNYANTLLLRGFSSNIELPSFERLYKLKPCAIATYPMYKGLAKLAGMRVVQGCNTLEEEAKALEENWENFDFFFVHIKKTDSAGEDGNWDAKKKVIEEGDRTIVSTALKKKPEVICITADHSTPCKLKSHSWHPVPVLIHSPASIPSDESNIDFSERQCARGTLGRFNALDLMPLLLSNAGKLAKFGA